MHGMINVLLYRLNKGCHYGSPVTVCVMILGPQSQVPGEAEYLGGGILEYILI